MIRREVCTYDKAIEIIRYIQDTAKKFDFSVYEEQYGQKLSDQQKYLIITFCVINFSNACYE